MRSQQIGIAVLTLAGLALGGGQTGPSRNSAQAADILLKGCTLEYKKTSLLGANLRTNLVYSKSAALLPETRSKRARSSAISATRSSGLNLPPAPRRRQAT